MKSPVHDSHSVRPSAWIQMESLPLVAVRTFAQMVAVVASWNVIGKASSLVDEGDAVDLWVALIAMPPVAFGSWCFCQPTNPV